MSNDMARTGLESEDHGALSRGSVFSDGISAEISGSSGIGDGIYRVARPETQRPAPGPARPTALSASEADRSRADGVPQADGPRADIASHDAWIRKNLTEMTRCVAELKEISRIEALEEKQDEASHVAARPANAASVPASPEPIEASPKPSDAAPAPQLPRRETIDEPAARDLPATDEKTAPTVREIRYADTANPVTARKDGASGQPPGRNKGAGGSSGNSGAGGSAGGSGGQRPPNLEARTGDPDFRSVIAGGLRICKKNFATVALFSFASNILLLSLPIYLFQISDRVLTSRSTDTLIMLTAVVVGLLLAHVLLDMMRRLLLMRVAVDVETRLGAPVLSAAARASYNGSSREFQTLGDLQQLRSFITGPVLLTMLDAPVAPLYMLVIFFIHPQLGMIIITTSVLLLLVATVNQRMTAVPFGRANAFASRANLQADAMARNAQVINAMGMIPESVLIWGRETAESLKAQVTGQDRNIIMAGLSKMIRLGTQIVMLGWGAWLVLDNQLTGGMIIAASIIGGRALAPVEGTIEGWKSFVHARSSYSRIRNLLQASPLNLTRLRLPRPQGRLTVERVLYVPPPNKKVILNGVSFTLEPGESLAIVGNSGAGKSTLAKMLVGSISPTAGNIRLDGMDLRNWDLRQYGENVGYLPQDVQLFPATIKANIARMRDDASDEAIFNAAELADVHELVAQFAQGYETQVSMDGSPLSGGQRQRIGLARAFFGEPRLVVLDEPNSNLDTLGERALAKALARARERGITVVAITQRPELLKSVDKIMILKDGTVQSVGDREAMIPIVLGQKPRLANGASGNQ